MDVEDYRVSNHQRMFLLHEKGGKEHQVPAHHRLVEYLGKYMDATGLWGTPKAPLFQVLDVTRSRLKGTRMNRQIVFQMVRRRARAAGLPPTVNCHSFRATGITNYLSNGGSLEDARAIAAHEGKASGSCPASTSLLDHSPAIPSAASSGCSPISFILRAIEASGISPEITREFMGAMS